MSFERTAIYTSITAFLILFLVYRAVTFRLKLGAGLGDDDNSGFKIAIRGHANIIEYVPTTLLLHFFENMTLSGVRSL